jgi:hypothetical protein
MPEDRPGAIDRRPPLAIEDCRNPAVGGKLPRDLGVAR